MRNLFQKLRGLLAPEGPKKKRDPFLQIVELFRQRAATWPKSKSRMETRTGVLLTPWLSTAVPFFALECVEMLGRAGICPVVIFDATDLVQNASEQTHAAALDTLLREQFSHVETHRVDSVAPQPGTNDATLAEPIFRENAIWRSRGEDNAHGFMADNQPARERIIAHIGQVRALLSSTRLNRILIPGGMFGLSAVYVAIARELGIPFSTFDGGAGVLRLAQQGVAAHLADVPVAFRQLRKDMTPEEMAAAIQLGRHELEDRMRARDARHYQVSAATGRNDLCYDILMPLNIRWDSAALGRQRAFASVAEWLDVVLNWVHERGDVSVCIRQHPRERLAFAKGSDDLRPLFARHERLGDRLRFVAADEPVNTYDLMRHARVVLPHTSTVGIEAASLGLPVVLGTSVYYEDFGFCGKAATREEYFAQIEEALRGNAILSPEQRDNAAIAYYLTQHCAFLQTNFTAIPDDFRKWVQIPHEQLWAQPELTDFRSAFLAGTPLVLTRHKRLSHAH